jgi:predicted PurR-regulated permease PerM
MIQTPPAQFSNLSGRRVVLATLVVVAVCLAFWLLFRFYNVLLILLVAVIISTAIKPVVDSLHRLGLPRPAGVIAIYLLLLALIVGFVLLGVPLISRQITTITAAVPQAYEQLREAMLTTPNLIIWRLGTELPEQLPFLTSAPAPPVEPVENEPTAAITQAWGFLRLIATAIFGTVVTLILAFYWTLDGERIKRTLLLLVPLDQRESIRELVATIEGKVGNFIIGQTLLCGIIGGLALIAYTLIGLPYALLLAFLAGIMEAIPVVGPVLGAVPAVLVALSLDSSKVIWVIVASVIIQQLENSLLVPRIMNRAVGVSPLVTLLALIAFSSLFGVIGAVIAIPMAAVIQLLLERYLLEPNAIEPETTNGRDRFSVLRYETQELVQDVRKQVRKKEEVASADSDQVEDSLEAIALDLDSLLAQSNSTQVQP